jgi:hypothetical protein
MKWLKDLDFKIFLLLLLAAIIFIKVAYAGCNVNWRKYIPVRAYKYSDMLVNEVTTTVPWLEQPWYFGGLIEQETCITLCSKRCWNPHIRFKTKREEGVGLGQLTRVFNKNGTVRWDIIAYLKKKFPRDLKELNWNNVINRPDLQIKAMVLLWDSNKRFFKNTVNRRELKWFLDSAYNGGVKFLLREQRICKLLANCNPHKWFGNVEKVKSGRARIKLYGNRTAWDINRQHVKNVRIRMKKYKMLWDEYYSCSGR